jgi:hypothetical protein
MDSLVAAHLARPAVLVMPDVNGAPRLWSEQCLNQVGGQQDATYRPVPPFRGIVSLWLHNNPMWLVRNWTPHVRLPSCWLSAARDNGGDYRALASFGLLLRLHQPAVPVFIVGSGGHTARTWRAATPRMLMWMTPLLASVTAPAQLNPALPRPGPPSELARPSSLGTR